jgi:ABC-type polysaccharide/polyol phosphate transport system ATPase subunit
MQNATKQEIEAITERMRKGGNTDQYIKEIMPYIVQFAQLQVFASKYVFQRVPTFRTNSFE